jgi:RNA polymerase sigma-70 factor (ECF subfamily)
MNLPDPPQESFVLLERLRTGDRGALGLLLDRYQARLLGRIRLMMGERARDCADSTDFLQATFLGVLERVEKVDLRDERDLLRWMTWIARNQIRTQVRREREERFESLSVSISGLRAGSGSQQDPLNEIAAAEQVFRLTEAIEELPEDLREIVGLRQLEGLEFQAIGERTGLSEEQVRWRHEKALLRLGRRLSGGQA